MDASERSPWRYVLFGIGAEELKKCVRSAASSQRNGRRRLELEGFEVGAKGVCQVGPGERELDGRLEEAELVARVEALAVERDRVHRAAGAQRPQRVGELDFAPRVRLRVGKDAKEVRRQHVASDDREVGRRLVRPRLLDEVEDLVHGGGDLTRGDHAVLRQALPRDALDGEHGLVVALEHVEELPHARFPRRDDVVAQEHGERLVAHERARTEDGVAQPERLLLAHVGHRGQLGDRLDLRELLHLAAVVQVVLQLEGGVEVVLDRTLAATGHDDDLRKARRHRLLDDVLDHRLVDQRGHLLRLGLRRRREPGAGPGGGEPGFSNPPGPLIPPACRRRNTPTGATYGAGPATAPTTGGPTSSGTERFWSTATTRGHENDPDAASSAPTSDATPGASGTRRPPTQSAAP